MPAVACGLAKALFKEQPMKTKHAAALTLLCGLAVVLTGCATILSGDSQTITIHSTPPGAYVKVGYQTGTTPVTFHVPKGQDYPVEIAHGPDKRRTKDLSEAA